MEALRTPDERFENLPDFPFEPNYVSVDDSEGGALRMHYIDEGSSGGLTIVLLHGEPTWSFLYRKMVPGLVDAGYRAIVPDQIGFGRSDKPTKQADYSVVRHVGWVRQFLQELDLSCVTFVGQDWGSLIGFTAAMHESERISAIVAAKYRFAGFGAYGTHRCGFTAFDRSAGIRTLASIRRLGR